MKETSLIKGDKSNLKNNHKKGLNQYMRLFKNEKKKDEKIKKVHRK